MRLKLSIARFEVSVPELKLAVEGFAQNRIKALESVVEDGRRVIADFLNQAMHAEMTLFLGREPSLVVLGISSSNRRSILAIEPGTRDSADAWRAVFHSLKQRGLDSSKVRVGVMDGLPGLEKAFREDFPAAITARCWFHSLQNAAAKTPKRLHDAFLILAKKIMYADGEVAARAAFGELEVAMNGDCQRAVDCLRKDLDSLVSHFKFPKKIWKALKTTNAVERIHKEFKRRSRSMEGVGEDTLNTLLAFTAMRLEMTWRRRAIDSYADMPPERLGIPFLDGEESAITRPEMH